MSIVIDSSAIVTMLRTSWALPEASHPAVDGHELHAPHLLAPEVLNSFRRFVRLGAIPADGAELLLDRFADLELTRYPHEPLAQRAWSLRDNVTPYDAMYVALAERLDLPFVTADLRLARAAEHYCEIVTVG